MDDGARSLEDMEKMILRAAQEGITDLVKPSAQDNGLPEGQVAVQAPDDNRYHYTVVLGYKSALIQAERERKGLNYDAKVAELEVDA